MTRLFRGSEHWEGRLDKHHVLCSIYSRAIKEGSGHNEGGLEKERVGRHTQTQKTL